MFKGNPAGINVGISGGIPDGMPRNIPEGIPVEFSIATPGEIPMGNNVQKEAL